MIPTQSSLDCRANRRRYRFGMLYHLRLCFTFDHHPQQGLGAGWPQQFATLTGQGSFSRELGGMYLCIGGPVETGFDTHIDKFLWI